MPNACYIGFTGTPVMKKDRNTVVMFGGLIDTYTSPTRSRMAPWCLSCTRAPCPSDGRCCPD